MRTNHKPDPPLNALPPSYISPQQPPILIVTVFFKTLIYRILNVTLNTLSGCSWEGRAGGGNILKRISYSIVYNVIMTTNVDEIIIIITNNNN